jgi:signal transduction histidine kinase
MMDQHLTNDFLAPPIADLPTRRRILWAMVLIAVVGSGTNLINDLITKPNWMILSAEGGFLVSALICAAMLLRGNLILVSWLLPFGLAIALAIIAYTQNGIHDISIAYFPVLIAFATVMMSRWGALLVSLLATLILAGLVVLETNGLIVNDFSTKTGYSDILPVLGAIWTTTAMLWVIMNNFWENLAKARNAEQVAQRLNIELEQRVAARTQELARANQQLGETNKELQETNHQLELANRELEAFSYSVSHDLRAPLRAINGFAGLLDEDYGELLPKEGRHFVGTIRRNTLRMSELIDGMLQFSRTSRQALERKIVDMAELARQVLIQLDEENRARHIQVDLAELPPCLGDEAMLRQVWYNLLSNAYKFTRKRDPAVVTIGYRKEADQVIYFVRDNGDGFDMHHAEHLFGVFQRLHRADDFEGTGIGLAITQRILQRHAGRIWADAQPDEGATFYFTL